jgi:hypothetical protein
VEGARAVRKRRSAYRTNTGANTSTEYGTAAEPHEAMNLHGDPAP